MTDTNTSGADALAALDLAIDSHEYEDKYGGQLYTDGNSLKKARTAVAALIEREAALTAAHAATERDACLQAERANELQSRLAALITERDALTAEVKALRDALQTMVDYAESPDFEGAPSKAAHENAIAVLAGVDARASAATGGGPE